MKSAPNFDLKFKLQSNLKFKLTLYNLCRRHSACKKGVHSVIIELHLGIAIIFF